MKTRIQEFRKAAGYSSARAFAESNGYNAKTYTNWEQGTATPSLAMAWELADKFDCTIDELVGRKSFDAKSKYMLLVDTGERELLDNFRELTPWRKRSISEMVEDAASRSKEQEAGSASSNSAVNE